jgi:nitroimidazol reductase NimA-like FMN-containing flavoprotein (pyridoxamine 5'-phosphate oxidase superfamily)
MTADSPRTPRRASRAVPAATDERAVAIPTGAPRITTMRPAACLALLKRHRVGRMAYALGNRVDITPIHYVYEDGWLFARTSHGTKMDVLHRSPWVAFEVDEMEGVFDWRSVVVHGTVYTMPQDGSPLEAELWQRGVDALRRIVPETATDDDPVPYRSIVFGIHVVSVSGRASSSRG